MHCPNCEKVSLKNSMTMEGISIEECPTCNGIWFDKGKIYFFTKKPQIVEININFAVSKGQAGKRLSPRSGKPMLVIKYPMGPELDYCTETHGLWLDGGELEKLNHITEKFKLTTQPEKPKPTINNANERSYQPQKQPGITNPAAATFASQTLRALPNLAFRSAVTIFGLYGLLTLLLITLSSIGYIDHTRALIIGVSFAILQFAFAPIILDFTLRWMHSLRWVDRSELKPETEKFIQKICSEHNIPFPRFGIIEDGAPQAFTYGHIPSNARIVISRGTIDLLEQDELEAVIAHEMGHVVHWDMLLMTVVQMVPLILYYIYRSCLNAKSSSNDDGKAAAGRLVIGTGAYILYIISEYLVLWFSRTREYHADRFSGICTNKPASLSSALVKIAYGLVGKNSNSNRDEKGGKMTDLGAMGIFDSDSAKSLVVTTYNPGTKEKSFNKSDIKAAMRWDKWNPWAKFYELHSTHPLVANRLEYLSNQSMHMGQEPYINFDEKKPESYWDEFFVDLFIYFLPIILALATPIIMLFTLHNLSQNGLIGASIFALGMGMLIKYFFIYPTKFFPEMSVSTLLSKVKVSSVRPVPVSIEGTVIGRGDPGYIFSEDFVLQDETGIIFLDYSQPLFLWDLFFGLLRAGKYHNTKVRVTGWYFRSPTPFIRINTLQEIHGEQNRCWTPFALKTCALFITMLGLVGIFL